MKNRSIRFKMTLWFSVVLIAVLGIAVSAIFGASWMVLRWTIRDYLISTVEENVDNIHFVPTKKDLAANSYIPYGDGYLEVDMDFMDVVNDVHTALYTSEGTLLYGENPLSVQTISLAFSESHIWNMKVMGQQYDLYDRKLNIALPDGNTLWIRGIVPETKSAAQLAEIAHLSLLLLPVLIFLSLLSGYILSGKFLSPIRKIEETAERISIGEDLKQRIEVGTNNDEIGRLARVFNRMLDRLERSFETERQFTSDASHELRTPTAVILAQSEYVLERERAPQEYIEALEVVQKQGQRLNTLISDMLDYTRLEQNSGRYPFETLDLSQIVSETAAEMSMIGSKGIALTAQIEDGLHITGNRLLLSRLVQNLIHNAYQYGRENGHILVSLTKDGTNAVLEVADDGIGIAAEDQERIFDRFYRGDASRSVQGTGLGLSMVKSIAALHGGEILVSSELDQGSTFRIIFPEK